jgi:hypothetical protein
MKPDYPFVPKSNKHLSPGDFWAIPLKDGTFGAGIVLELYPKGRPGAKVAFLAGLLDWHGTSMPTCESIAGSCTLKQGVAHILAVTQTGGVIIGNRALQLDGIEPWVFINGNLIQRGFTELRESERKDAGSYPSLSWWGYDVIQIYANKLLLGQEIRA